MMESFELVSKRDRKIYKEGLFPSKWSGSATAISLPKDFSHNTKNLAMIFGGDILSKSIERTTSPPLFYHVFSLKASGYHLIVGTTLALLGIAYPPPPQNKTVL